PDLFSASRLGNAPGYSTGSSAERPGWAKYLVKILSSAGGSEFHSSLCPIGMMTSLTSGLPSRETCRNGPLSTFLPWSASHSLTPWRLAVVHTPMVGWPDLVTVEIGTWIAIEWTFRWLVAFTPAAFLVNTCLPNTLAVCSGRRLPRSKIEPRST